MRIKLQSKDVHFDDVRQGLTEYLVGRFQILQDSQYKPPLLHFDGKDCDQTFLKNLNKVTGLI
jgi:hypothetical protein